MQIMHKQRQAAIRTAMDTPDEGSFRRACFLVASMMLAWVAVAAGAASESLDIYRVNNNVAGPWTVISEDTANHRHGIKVDREFGGLVPGGSYRVGYALEALDGADAAVEVQMADGTPLPVTVVGSTSYTAAFTAALTGVSSSTVYLAVDPGLPLGDHRVRISLQKHDGFSWKGIAFVNGSGDPNPTAFTEVRSFPGGTDKRLDIKTRMLSPSVSRAWMVSGSDHDTFESTASLECVRYDADSAAAVNRNVRIEAKFRDASGKETPALVGTTAATVASTLEVPVAGIQAKNAGLPATPYQVPVVALNLHLKPTEQLDCLAGPLTVIFSVSHDDTSIVVPSRVDGSGVSLEASLLHFSGKLSFGDVETTINTLTGGPAGIVVPAGGLASYNATLTGVVGSHAAGHDFGPSNLDVTLWPDGHASVRAPSFVLLSAPSSPDETTAFGSPVKRGPIRLDSTGGTALSAFVRLPQGMGWAEPQGADPQLENVMEAWLSSSNVSLDGNLLPDASSIILTAPGVATFYVSEESKPVRWSTNQVIWQTGMKRFKFTASDIDSVHGDEWEALVAASSAAVKPNWLEKRSNLAPLHFAQLNPSATEVTASVGASGDAKMSFSMNVVPGSGGVPCILRPHFPDGCAMTWDASGFGTMTVANDRFITGGLSGVSGITQIYQPEQSGDHCNTLGNQTLNAKPVGNAMTWTADGGLDAALEILTPAPGIRWGAVAESGTGVVKPVHEVKGWTNGSARFLTSGCCLVPGAWNYTGAGNIASESVELLLNSGFLPNGAALIEERPHVASYQAGDGDYPGLNLRASGVTGATSGITYLGGERIPGGAGTYEVKPNSKYYVRLGGVSGVHDVDASSFAGEIVPIYGYEMVFSVFGLAYLDNENRVSRGGHEESLASTTAASLEFTGPPLAGFGLQFSEIGVTGDGQIENVTVEAADNPQQPIDYWGGGILPKQVSFEPLQAAACSNERLLTIGAEAYAALVKTPLHGELGIASATTPSATAPNVPGNLVSLTDAAPFGVRPRMRLPSRIDVRGTATTAGGSTSYETYKLTPSADAYFNEYSAGGPPEGFISFAGKLGVSFFEDLSVHVRTRAVWEVDTEAAGSGIYLSGGWQSAGKDFWSDVDFDGDHQGYSGNFTNYWTANQGIAANAIHARQQLFGIVPLDYPVGWDPLRRLFTAERQSADLIVLDARHRLEFLSAERSSITFGVKAEVDGLPDINLGTVAFNAVDSATGVLSSIREAASEKVGHVLDSGTRAVENLIDSAPDEMIDGVWDNAIQPIITGEVTTGGSIPLLESVRSILQADADFETRLGELDAYFDPADPDWLLKSISQAMLATDKAGSLVGQIDIRLMEAQNAIRAITSVAVSAGTLEDLHAIRADVPGGDGSGGTIPWNEMKNRTLAAYESPISGGTYTLVRGLLPPPSNGSEEAATNVFSRLAASLIVQAAKDADIPSSVLSFTDIDGLALKITPEINADLKPTLDTLRSNLILLDEKIQMVRDELGASGELLAEMQALLDTSDAAVKLAFAPASLEMKALLVAKMRLWKQTDLGNFESDAFRAEFAEFFKREFRDEFLNPLVLPKLQLALRQHVQDLQASIRMQMESVFAQAEQAVKKQLVSILSGLDLGIDSSLFAPFDKIAGYGELDGHLSLVGDSADLLRLDAYLDLKAPESMKFHGFLEIKALHSTGAGGCDYGGKDATEITLGAIDMPFDWIGSGIRMDVSTSFTFDDSGPRGFGGSFEMTSGSIDFEAFAIEEMGAASAFGEDENYLACKARVRMRDYTMAGGLFFGKACKIDPIAIAHEETAELLYDGNSFTGALVYGYAAMPLNEMLGIPSSCMLRITAGIGAGAFFFFEGPTFGGTMDIDESGEALCVVSVGGRVSMVGAKVGNDLRFQGKGRLKGKAGCCPFCVKFSKTVKFEFVNKRWKIDY